MNFAQARLSRDDGAFFVELGDSRLRVDDEAVATDDTRELAADTGHEMVQKLEEEASEHKTPFVARMHARSRAREGERVDVAVDTRELHFFDLETGAGIYA